MFTMIGLQTTLKELKSREGREALTEAFALQGIGWQVRVMRLRRGWTQKELAERAGMSQPRLSKIEDTDYGRVTISTLLKLAKAFDSSLLVRFAGFSRVVREIQDLSSDAIAAPSYEEDAELEEMERTGKVRSPKKSPSAKDVAVAKVAAGRSSAISKHPRPVA